MENFSGNIATSNIIISGSSIANNTCTVEMNERKRKRSALFASSIEIKDESIDSDEESTKKHKEAVSSDQFQTFVMKTLITISDTLSAMQRSLDRLERKDVYYPEVEESFDSNEEYEISLPLESEEDLETFDAKLRNPSFMNKMTNFLKSTGGCDVAGTTATILTKLISDSIAVKYSWQGRKGKKSFKQLNLSKLVIRAVHKICITVECTDLKIIEYGSKWLAQAKCRLMRIKQKKVLI